MEENKKQEKNENHGGRECHGFRCQCSSTGHKIVKLILIIVVIVMLLSIGAAFGARRAERFNGFYRHDGFGCRFQNENDWRDNRERGGRQFNMMRGNPDSQFENGDFPAGAPSASNQVSPTETSTPDFQ